MGPDVASLCVDAEDAPEAGPEGGHRGPVAVQQVVVVLQPVGEHVVWDDPPAALPDLQQSALSTAGRAAPATGVRCCRGTGGWRPHPVFRGRLRTLSVSRAQGALPP